MHFNTKAISVSVAALQFSSVAFAQATCWAAKSCSGSKFDGQPALFAFGSTFCAANSLNQSGTGTSTSGLSTAIFANGPYATVGDCTTAFTTIVATCLGKGNGGLFVNTLFNGTLSSTTTAPPSSTSTIPSVTTTISPSPTPGTPRLVVSFGNCEIV